MRLFIGTTAFIALLLNFGCESQKSVSVEPASVAVATKAEQSIVFLFFEIEKTTDGNEIIKLTDKKITAGIMKEGSIDNKENTAGNIAVTFLGKDGKAVSERIIEDPLNPMMETYSEEGLNREKMVLPKAEFSMRFNQTGNISAVKLEKITPNSKKQLLTIQL